MCHRKPTPISATLGRKLSNGIVAGLPRSNAQPPDHLRNQAMIKCKPLPPCEVLEEWFDVDFSTGTLFWKKKPSKNVLAGAVAGWKQEHTGKIRWSVNVPAYSRFLRSRIVWKLYYGYDPQPGLDHKDGNSTNDAISNLSDKGWSWNSRNKPVTAKSGFVGAYPASGKKWQSTIQRHGRTIYLGVWATPQEASAAYLEALERFRQQDG